MIRLALILMLLALLPSAATAAELAPDDIRFSIEFEERPSETIEGEMIIMTIRGAYRPHITLEEIEQPDFDGFDWMQLGPDRWWRSTERGIPQLNLERRMALFPQRPGALTVRPVRHKLTLLTPGGRRFEHVAESNELTLDVAPAPADVDWWFPVRSIQISDEWSNQPEQLEPGGGALRIIVLSAEGIKPELIPPMPEMTGAGALIFPHPEKRIVTLGADGPLTRVFWRWTVRPGADSAGFVNPVDISYFDAEVREARTITLSAQRVAYRGVKGASAPPPRADQRAAPAPEEEAAAPIRAPAYLTAALVPATLVAGGLAGLALLWSALRGGAGGARPASRDNGARARRRALRRAARAGDARAVWRIGAALTAGRTPPAPLAALERALFAPGEHPRPDLDAVVRALRAAGPFPGDPGRPTLGG